MQFFYKFMFLAVVTAAGVLWWVKSRHDIEYNRQVGALATTMDRRLANPLSPSGQADAMFLRSMVVLAEFRDLKRRGILDQDDTTYIYDALDAAGYNNPLEINLIAENLKENLALCDETGVLSDGLGSQALLTGQPPRIQTGPFEGENLVISRRISPQLAPEVLNHPANFALTPAPQADLIWPYTLTDRILRTATDLKAARILDVGSVESIRQRSKEIREVNGGRN